MCRHYIIVCFSMLGIVCNGSNLSYPHVCEPRRSFSAICAKLFQIQSSHLIAYSWWTLEQSSSMLTNPLVEAWILDVQVSHNIRNIWIFAYGVPRSCRVQMFCHLKRPTKQVTRQISPHSKATLHIDVPGTWRFRLRNKNREQVFAFSALPLA